MRLRVCASRWRCSRGGGRAILASSRKLVTWPQLHSGLGASLGLWVSKAEVQFMLWARQRGEVGAEGANPQVAFD